MARLFDNLVCPYFEFIFVISSSLTAVSYNSVIARKGVLPFPINMHPIPLGAYKAIFKQKRFLLIQFYEVLLVLFYFDLFLYL